MQEMIALPSEHLTALCQSSHVYSTYEQYECSLELRDPPQRLEAAVFVSVSSATQSFTQAGKNLQGGPRRLRRNVTPTS